MKAYKEVVHSGVFGRVHFGRVLFVEIIERIIENANASLLRRTHMPY